MNGRRSLPSAVYLIVQPVLLNLASIPATAYIIRCLGPSGYGQWATATALVATMTFLTNLGLRPLFIRSVAQNPEGVGGALAEQLGLRGLMAFLAAGLALLLCACLHYPVIVLGCVAVASLGLFLTALGSAGADVLKGHQRFPVYAGANFMAGLILTAVSLLVVWRHGGPLGVSVAYLSGPAVSMALLLRAVHREICPVRVRLDVVRFRQLLREIQPLAGQQALSTVQDRLEQVLVPKMVGLAAFGYFSAGIIPVDRLTVFPDGLATAFYPKMAKSHAADPAAAAALVSRLLVVSLTVCLFLTILVFFAVGPISQILFPRSAATCRQVMAITIWALPLVGITMPMLYSLQAVGKHSEAARATVGATCVAVVLSLLLISRFGILGACWSWVLKPGLTGLFLLPCFLRIFPTVASRCPLARIALCGALMAALLWYASHLPALPLVTLSLGSALAACVYLAALVATGVVEKAELLGLLRRKQFGSL